MAKIRSEEQFHDGHQDGFEPLRAVDLNQIHSFSDMLHAFRDASFGARRLGEALDVLEEMMRSRDTFVVCTLSGAMTVAKMGLVLCEMIERGYVDAIVSTGALQAHGMIEDSGMQHFKYRPGLSDTELFERGYDRVYDTLELEKNLDELEILVRKVLDTMPGGEPVGSRELTARLGAYLSENFPESRGILKSAYEHRVPVIIPAFTDSELGLDVAVHNILRERTGRAPMKFDPFRDLNFYADTLASRESLGIFTVGGGVPRNWAQQVAPFLEIMHLRLGNKEGTTQRFRYGVRLCPEPENWGGLSGCSYREGMSWGKFVPEEEGGRFAEVPIDATVVWPILIKGLIELIPKKEKNFPPAVE